MITHIVLQRCASKKNTKKRTLRCSICSTRIALQRCAGKRDTKKTHLHLDQNSTLIWGRPYSEWLQKETSALPTKRILSEAPAVIAHSLHYTTGRKQPLGLGFAAPFSCPVQRGVASPRRGCCMRSSVAWWSVFAPKRFLKRWGLGSTRKAALTSHSVKWVNFYHTNVYANWPANASS